MTSVVLVCDRGRTIHPADRPWWLQYWYAATELGCALGNYTWPNRSFLIEDRSPDERAWCGLGPREVAGLLSENRP